VAYAAGVGAHEPVTVRAMPKEARRLHLNEVAMRTLVNDAIRPTEELWALAGVPGSPFKLPMEYLTALWREELREKTWTDALTLEQQAEFAQMKQNRDAVFKQVEALRSNALTAMKHYFQYLDQREANANAVLENWVAQRLPVRVTTRPAPVDPLVTSWDAAMRTLGIVPHAGGPVRPVPPLDGGTGPPIG
jgi:hypothetical protein